MKLEEFYEKIGSSYSDVFARFSDEEFILHFVLKFGQDKSFDNLKAALESGDVTVAFRAAHTLKGVTANLGFTELYEKDYVITEALRAGDIETAKSLFPELENLYETVIDALNTCFNTGQ